MQLTLLKNLSLSNIQKSGDEKFVYFVAFLYALSTGGVEAVDLVRTAQHSKYGRYTQAIKDTFRLGVGWGYGLANALEMISIKVSSDKTDSLKQLMVKLAQVVRLGHALKIFFKAEMKSNLSSFTIIYERKLENIKLFLEMFYTLMSTAAFMVAANSIMTMLIGSQDAEQVLVLSMFGVGISMSVFVFMMYIMFPRDKMAFGANDEELKFRLRVYMSIGAGVGIGVVLLFSGLIPPMLVVGIAMAPLIYPGLLARKMENNIQQINNWYPQFVQHFGEIYATVGSMGQALDAVLRSDFGPLQKHIISLKNRIKNRIENDLAFELFSRESVSEVIANGNQVITYGIEKGADMNETGGNVADITSKINELRAKRSQTAKTFETVIVVLHVLTLSVFGLMSKLTGIFHDLISSVDISNSAFALTPIDPEFMNMMIPIMILMTSIISAMALKVGQGGLYKTVFFNIALFGVLGSVVSFAMNYFMSEFLETSILEFSQI